jgi:hypothetical protein
MMPAHCELWSLADFMSAFVAHDCRFLQQFSRPDPYWLSIMASAVLLILTVAVELSSILLTF